MLIRLFSIFLTLVLALLSGSCVSPVATSGAASESVTLIYSGNLDGELEPCGCSEAGNLGGIKRRATTIDRLRSENPDLILVSAGGLISSMMANEKLTADYILKAFEDLGYDAIGVQWPDLAYGLDFIKPYSLPWVATNWSGASFPTQREVRRGDQRWVFFTWLDPETAPQKAMKGEHLPPLSHVGALSEGLAKAKAEKALTILTTTLPLEEAQALLDLSDVDILFVKAAYEVYGEPLRVGNTLVVQPGSRGMRLGRLDLQISNEGKIVDFVNTILPMPPDVPDSPRFAAWYDAYNAAVKEAYERSIEVRRQLDAGESPFIGAEACEQCHSAQSKVWVKSRHAGAYDTLAIVNKAFDPACIRCHTVGFNKPGGFIDDLLTEHLKHVQCESCHGAARAHAESAGTQRVTNSDWAPEQMCAQCHVQKHSPDFVFEKYWPKIAH